MLFDYPFSDSDEEEEPPRPPVAKQAPKVLPKKDRTVTYPQKSKIVSTTPARVVTSRTTTYSQPPQDLSIIYERLRELQSDLMNELKIFVDRIESRITYIEDLVPKLMDSGSSGLRARRR